MSDRSSRPWFAAKRYGYGASLPIAWQGWAVLALFLAVVLAVSTGLTGSARAAGIVLATAALVLVCWYKTDGAWRWRWGERR